MTALVFDWLLLMFRLKVLTSIALISDKNNYKYMYSQWIVKENAECRANERTNHAASHLFRVREDAADDVYNTSNC